MAGSHTRAPSPTRPRPGLAVAVIGVALVAGLGTPWFLDYDEAVYAEVAHGMQLSGDWLRPTSNGAPFYEKPVLFYWLLALAFKLVGFSPVAARLVSTLALCAGLAWLAREVARWATREAAESAVWVAGASLLPFTLGRFGVLDALLTAAVTVALLAFLRGLEETDPRRRRTALAAGYAATGVALAVKGPVFPLIVAAVLLCDALVRRRVWRTLRLSGILWGIPLTLAVGVPPYVLTAAAVGPGFLSTFLGAHTLGRALTPMQGHRGWPLYYLAVLAVGLMPFSAFLPAAFLRARHLGGAPRRLAGFAATWGLVTLVAFSAAATKLPNYIAPAVPAFAILVALALARDDRADTGAFLASAAVAGAAALAIAAIPSLLARAPLLWGRDLLVRAPELAHLPHGLWPRLGFIVAAVALASGALAAWRFSRAGTLAGVRALGLTGALAWSALLIAAGGLVNAASIAPVRALARAASRDLPPAAPIYVLEMNARVTQNLETGRRTVYLQARSPADRERVRALLAGDTTLRLIVGDALWGDLSASVGGRELAREGAYVLVGGRPGPAGADH